jgi:hypothetical protein
VSSPVGRFVHQSLQSREPRYNNMRKNFSAIVGVDVSIV